MTTEDFIINLFCVVDDRMGDVPKRSDAVLYPSELVTIVLSDLGFTKAGEPARNLKFCAHKTWSERMLVETIFSLVTRACQLKRLFHRRAVYLETHLSLVAALFNLLLALNRLLEPDAPLDDRLLHLAQYSL